MLLFRSYCVPHKSKTDEIRHDKQHFRTRKPDLDMSMDLQDSDIWQTHGKIRLLMEYWLR